MFSGCQQQGLKDNNLETGKSQSIEVSLPSLPKSAEIAAYIQQQLVDLDGDGIEEGVAIYYQETDDAVVYDVFFVIYKFNQDYWSKIIEQPLEAFALWQDKDSPFELAKLMNSFELVDLDGDGLAEVLVKTRSQGSGRFFVSILYGLKGDSIEEVWMAGPAAHGEVGIEADKLWFIVPLYEDDDPNCCPSFWMKVWYQWKDGQFKELASKKIVDFEELKALPYK